jgi:hypothetical protein
MILFAKRRTSFISDEKPIHLVNTVSNPAKCDCSKKNTFTTTGGKSLWFNFHLLCF